VKRLQDFARVRAEGPALGGTIFDFSHTVREAIEMSKPWWQTAAEREGISISLTRQIKDRCLVKGHENELFDVIVNLVKNATEALPMGGEIDVATFVQNDEVITQVRDNGQGIAEKDLGKIFEPFWTTKGTEGTGLGLAGSYGIVRRHGGSISVSSKRDHGSLFTVKLPIAQASGENRAEKNQPRIASGLRILVIDDMTPVLELLEEGLKEYNHTVFTASSGPEGLEICEHSKIDVVICDLGMPDMNGWHVSKAIRRMFRKLAVPKPPFILLTGWGGQVSQGHTMSDFGVDLVVEKPVDIPKLAAAVSDLVHDTSTQSP
jgi:two-component system, cell cycle sensor histidine kinase and response regulator CckA